MHPFQNAISQSYEFYTKLTLKEKLMISNHGYFGAPEGKSCKGEIFYQFFIKQDRFRPYKNMPTFQKKGMCHRGLRETIRKMG